MKDTDPSIPTRLEDYNSTLDLGQRALNLQNLYNDTLPNLASHQVPLYEAALQIHTVAMHNQSTAAGLENVADRLTSKGIDPNQVQIQPGKYRDRETTELIGYYTTVKGTAHTKEDGLFTLHVSCPSEEAVPDLMRGISDNLENMLTQAETLHDSTKLAIWASQLTFWVHPFYDGNGRTSRALFPYILERSGQEPLFLENERHATDTRALPFLLGVGLKTLIKLYASNPSTIPGYIPMTRNPITPADILGLPDYATHDETVRQKRQSLENVITAHLATVDMNTVRQLITDEDVSLYRENSLPKPTFTS